MPVEGSLKERRPAVAAMSLPEALLRRLLPGEELGDQTSRFLRGLGWVGLFSLLARGLSFGVQLAAGRCLGPEEFGVANLVQAAAMVLLIPLQIGFPAALELLPGRVADERERSRLSAGLLALAVLWFCLALLGTGALRAPLGALLRLTPSLFVWAAAFAGFSAALTLASSALQGLQLFPEMGKAQGIYGCLLAGLFFSLWPFLGARFESYLSAYLGAMAGGTALAVCYLLPAFQAGWEIPGWSAVGSYLAAPFAQTVMNCAATALVPLLLAAYSGSWGVGVFSAYSLGSIAISQVIGLGILSAVLVPLSSGPGRFAGAWRRFRSLGVLGAAASFVVFFCSTAVAMRLMGGRYPSRWDWIAAFAAAGAVGLLYWVARSLLSAHGVRGLWSATAAMVVEVVCTLGVLLLAVPRYGFAAVPWALLLAYALALSWCLFWGERLESA